MACNPILIIEDERDARESLRQLLQLEGFHATTAENGKVGLEMIQNDQQPCLILLDLMMPVMNGWQFLEALNNDHQHVLRSVPLIVISAAADVGETPQSLGCRVMRKPLDFDQLLRAAREHCSGTSDASCRQTH